MDKLMMKKSMGKNMKKRLMLGAIAKKVKESVDVLLSEEEENRICKGTVISNKVFCLILSCAFYYHRAVAKIT